MARIAEHLGIQLATEPVFLVQATRDIVTNTAGLGEFMADSTSHGGKALIESTPS